MLSPAPKSPVACAPRHPTHVHHDGVWEEDQGQGPKDRSAELEKCIQLTLEGGGKLYKSQKSEVEVTKNVFPLRILRSLGAGHCRPPRAARWQMDRVFSRCDESWFCEESSLSSPEVKYQGAPTG